MSNYRDILIDLLKHAMLSAPFIGFGMYALLCMGSSGGGLMGSSSIILGAIILAFPLARLVAEPGGNLYWPGKELDRPQPMYSIPQAKRARGLFDEAMAGFQRIASEYPEEVKPYVEMIDIAVVDLRDKDMAAAIYRRGISVLKNDDDREALKRMYLGISSRLDAGEKNDRQRSSPTMLKRQGYCS